MIRRYKTGVLPAPPPGSYNTGVLKQTWCEELVSCFSYKTGKEYTRWDSVSYTQDTSYDIPKGARLFNGIYYTFGHEA